MHWFHSSGFSNSELHGQSIALLAFFFLVSGFHLLYQLDEKSKFYSLVCFTGFIINISDVYQYRRLHYLSIIISIPIGFKLYMNLARECKMSWSWLHTISNCEENLSAFACGAVFVMVIRLARNNVSDIDPDFLLCFGTSILISGFSIRFTPIFIPFALQYFLCAILHYYQIMPESNPLHFANLAMVMNTYMHMIIFNIYPYMVVQKPLEVKLCEPLDNFTDNETSIGTVESVRLDHFIEPSEEESSSVFYWRSPKIVPSTEMNPKERRKRTVNRIMNILRTSGDHEVDAAQNDNEI